MSAHKSIAVCFILTLLSQLPEASLGSEISPFLVFADQAVPSVSRIGDLPASIQSLLAVRIPEGIADPGVPFNATDHISDTSRLSRRLHAAGRAGPLWFIWYEHGGRGYHQHLVLVRDEISSAQVVGSAVFLQEPRDLAALRHLAKAGALAPSSQAEPEHW